MGSPDHATTLEDTYRELHELEREHAMWLEDIGRWRTEHRRAAAMLAQAQAALLEHEAALESHAETVRRQQSLVQRQERTLAERQGGRVSPDQDEQPGVERAYRDEHGHTHEAHQRIKEHHAMVTSEIGRLSQQLSAPV